MVSKLFTDFAAWVAQATGRPITFVICVVMIVVWAVSGPLFGYSDTWQLVINTATTIVTFTRNDSRGRSAPTRPAPTRLPTASVRRPMNSQDNRVR